ncbi:alpha/beta hydrolase [Alcanivorax sp. JB21]|uniref:alpha/beta hydrolase n=1 Tax=Alcanivorax limicola TaxID=2874102 RepID=UPI001CC0FDD3|nr:alpha/beta hydrolase [Alcanivorax limicola]MBZ2189278.1 alpha/beta hydrolase [Alcanivorax limicola]
MALFLRLTLLLVLTAQLGACTGIFFYPMSDWVQNPARQDLDYEDVILLHPDGLRLHGWWLPAQGEDVRGTVYFLHGNAQNISTHLMNVAWLPAQGYQVFLLDYREYGMSEGKARLPAVFDDIQLGLDWLQASGRVEGPLIVFGQSLGASMAPNVLAREANQGSYDCVIMEAGFTGFRDIVQEIMRGSWVLWPFSFVVAPTISTDWDARDHIAALAPKPILLLHSHDDQIIPFHHGETLFEAAQEPKTFQALRGGHIISTRDPSVQERLVDFMASDCAGSAR